MVLKSKMINIISSKYYVNASVYYFLSYDAISDSILKAIIKLY